MRRRKSRLASLCKKTNRCRNRCCAGKVGVTARRAARKKTNSRNRCCGGGRKAR